MVGHFQRISQTTTVPAPPESLRDMEFDMTRGDSSSDHNAEDEGHILLTMRRAVILKWNFVECRKRVANTIMTLNSQLLPTVKWKKCALHQISGVWETCNVGSRLRDCMSQRDVLRRPLSGQLPALVGRCLGGELLAAPFPGGPCQYCPYWCEGANQVTTCSDFPSESCGSKKRRWLILWTS